VGDAEPAKPPEHPAPKSAAGAPWGRIAFLTLVVYLILIVLFNREQVDVSFVFFSAEISLVVLILLCVGLGFAAGYLFDQLRARRKRSSSSA
jgi:uncharacterized integral membrane protein